MDRKVMEDTYDRYCKRKKCVNCGIYKNLRDLCEPNKSLTDEELEIVYNYILGGEEK